MCAYCGFQFRDCSALSHRPLALEPRWRQLVAALLLPLVALVAALSFADATEPPRGGRRGLIVGLCIGALYAAIMMMRRR